MADWDEDSPQLRENLTKLLAEIAAAARSPALPTVAHAKAWQRAPMKGLSVPHRPFVGRFRGEPGLEGVQVRIGDALGSPPDAVASELAAFEAKLQRVIGALDEAYRGRDLDTDGLAGVIDVAAWAHAEWVRVHPFANGNGRTARMWANFVLLRYGIPPAVRLRPRPDGGYGAAGARAR
jgi:hypothetical protein